MSENPVSICAVLFGACRRVALDSWFCMRDRRLDEGGQLNGYWLVQEVDHVNNNVLNQKVDPVTQIILREPDCSYVCESIKV